MPFGKDSLDFDKMVYLNSEQALSDLAYFIQQMRDTHTHKIVDNSPFITIGGSYPGALSAWFRYKYPHLTIGAIASSAVVLAIEDFKNFD
jgi:pimeloyl-ACP methyl ester carboxylesterase